MDKQTKDRRVEEAKKKVESLRKKKARIAQVLSRGLVNHRLEVSNADPNRFYAWVRERDEDIAKYEALGFRIETEAGESLHESGDNRRRVGDVILMSIDREDYDIIREVQAERAAKRLRMGKREYLEKAERHVVPIIGDMEE